MPCTPAASSHWRAWLRAQRTCLDQGESDVATAEAGEVCMLGVVNHTRLLSSVGSHSDGS